MKQLSKKVFITIFFLLSTFILLGLIIFNVQNYHNEYENIKKNLNFRKMDDERSFKNELQDFPKDLDNMMIMDYEVYTVLINNKKVSSIISHGINITNFDIETISNHIIEKNGNNNQIKIGNLYTSKYSYNYKYNQEIIVINNNSTNEKLIKLLIMSIIILIIMEVIIYFISKRITSWIVKPAKESFDKQKEFIADASHELKTPLAIIMASSDELNMDKKNAKYINNIKFETERMSTLIKNMLDLSKIENGISKSTFKDENLSKIVEKICLTFEGMAYEEEVEIKTKIDKNIHFKCSKEEIEKLISILIDNAIKHSYKNSNIEVLVTNQKNDINIEITNNGDIINESDLEKIFERFYRVDKARNRNDNRYGLGLAIAKSIVINHNGTIKAISKDNKTTFKINLKK